MATSTSLCFSSLPDGGGGKRRKGSGSPSERCGSVLPSESKAPSSSGRYCASLILRHIAHLGSEMVGYEKLGAEGERVHASLQYYTKFLAKCPDSGGGGMTTLRETLSGFYIPMPKSASNYFLNKIINI